ncbi:MAG: thioredoxin domain-containing protein [Pseudanabaenaceae cyanobacterium]
MSSHLSKFALAIAAVCFTVVLYFGWQVQTSQVSLRTVVAEAIPYETALQNGKPTLIEFYADWCESCQAMAKANHQLVQQYGDRINFVMLNVDNNKWLPELAKYRVDGIPRWIWLNAQREQVGDGSGLMPKAVMEANIWALLNGQPLPYSGISGDTSKITVPQADGQG